MIELTAAGPGHGVNGHYMPGYEKLADAFVDTLARGMEGGAALAVFKSGIPVLDLWGGLSDRRTGMQWREDTLVPVYSVTKGVAALYLLHLVDQGQLALDAPVTAYWPEFGQHGKHKVTVRELMAHRAGLPFVEGGVQIDELEDPAHMAARLAGQVPLFAPGVSHLYHGLTMGWLTGELVRRVTGKSLGRCLVELARRREIELYLGLPEAVRPRVAYLEPQSPDMVAHMQAACPPGSLAWKIITLNGAISPLPGGDGVDFNDYALQSKEMAGANLVTSARSLAAFYDFCLERPGCAAFVSARTLADACRPMSYGAPFQTEQPGASWGAGLMLPFDHQPMLGGASFGHDGFGGSLAFADPLSGISFAYVRNQLAPGGAKDQTVYRHVDVLQSIILKR